MPSGTDRREEERQFLRRVVVYHIPAMLAIVLLSACAILLTRKAPFLGWPMNGLVIGVFIYNIVSLARHLSDPIYLDYQEGTFSGERRHGLQVAFSVTDLVQVARMSTTFGSGRSYWSYYRIWLQGTQPFMYVDRRCLTPVAAAELERISTDDPWVVE